MSSADKSQNRSSTTPNSSTLNASTGSSNLLKENQKQNTPSSPKQPSPKQPSPKQPSPEQPSPKQPSPKQPSAQPLSRDRPNEPSGQRPVYLDDFGKINPNLYYNQPFFTRRPNIVSRDTVLPNLDADADNEYLFLNVHGEIGRRLSGGDLVLAPPNSNGIKKMISSDEQRQINHYLRIIEISTPHEIFSSYSMKSIIGNIHDKLTSPSKKRFFSTSLNGKTERTNFFKQIKKYTNTPNGTVDSVHLVDVIHDRLFCGHIDIANLYIRNRQATFDMLGGMNYMGLLKPIRPVEFRQNPNITDIEKDELETFKLYADSQWLGAPDGANFERISLFNHILSLAQHKKKRLNIIICACSGLVDPFNSTFPSSQPYYYRNISALTSDHKGSMYAEPIKILKTGCDFINRMEFILHNLVSSDVVYWYKWWQTVSMNHDESIRNLYNVITVLINNLFSKSLLQTINTNEFGIVYLFSDLLSLSHNGESIFTSRLDVDDFELLLFSTKIYLSEEIFKHLIGLLERVIRFIDTDFKNKSEFIIHNKKTAIWEKSLADLGLKDQVFNDQSYPNFFLSVGHAVEYLFNNLFDFKTRYLERVLHVLNSYKHNIDDIQSELSTSNMFVFRSDIANTIGYKAVKLVNERRVVFENLVKKHCSHHYKYKSRTPNDGIVKNRSTRSYRPESMRRQNIGKIRNDTDPFSPTSSAEERTRGGAMWNHPLYAKRDTISRNRRVKKALQQLNEPLNDKIIGVLGRDQKERNMSKGRIERNNPGGVFMTNRLHAFGDMLSKETRKNRVSSRGNASRSSRSSRKRINHSV
jgi:hypothetical protein